MAVRIFSRSSLTVLVVAALMAAVATPAQAASAKTTSQADITRNPPVPAAPNAATGFSISAVQDGVWHSGEIGLWRHSNFGTPIYDTAADTIYHYRCCLFVNSNVGVNDQVSSIANAKSSSRRAYEHEGYRGGSVLMLAYGQCNSNTCYAYSSLGWANDRLTSHTTY